MSREGIQENLKRVVENHFIVLPRVHRASLHCNFWWRNLRFSAANGSPRVQLEMMVTSDKLFATIRDERYFDLYLELSPSTTNISMEFACEKKT